MRALSSSSSWWNSRSYLLVFGCVLGAYSTVAVADQQTAGKQDLGPSAPLDFPTALHLDPTPLWPYQPIGWTAQASPVVLKYQGSRKISRTLQASVQPAPTPPARVYPAPSPASLPAASLPASVRAPSPPAQPTAIDIKPKKVLVAASHDPAGEADSIWSGSYIALRLLPSLSDVSGISRTPAAPIGLIDDAIEFVAAGTVALGYDWRRRHGIPLKTELEYRYRYHFDIETRSPSTNTFYNTSTKAAHTVQLNAWLPWNVAERLDLLFGGGIGVTRHITETDRRNTVTTVTEEQTNEDDNFTWHVGLGTDYRFAENWSVETMYRYADLGEITVGPFTTGDSVTYDRAFSHEVVLGIDYHF